MAWLLALLACAEATSPPPGGPPTPAAAGVAHSWYVGDLDPGRLHALGAAGAQRAVDLRLGSSVTVLDLGDPADDVGGTALPDRRGTATPAQSSAAVLAFASGWAGVATPPPLVLVVGASNYGDHVGAAHGAAWGRLVESVAAQAPAGVDVRGGLDAEPGYAGPRPTRAWARAYLAATTRPLVDFGDCGCEPDQRMEHGWTRADRAAIAAAGSVLAQVYRTSGVDARRWASLDADVRRRYGRPMQVLGTLTQGRACTGPPARACAGTDTTPVQAVARLSAALGRPVPAGSDIGYLAPPPPPAPVGAARGGSGRAGLLALLSGLVLAGLAAALVLRRVRATASRHPR